ncbi:MAG TPA: peptidylprolyl isomerase [Candidatus Acidoferrum sp.]|jgi:cyclophilin family peptidyl-prolyl cis-trans isomerase|nr:peptidylprolyl isomerase [Candidatus Acidoferrum sp.]
MIRSLLALLGIIVLAVVPAAAQAPKPASADKPAAAGKSPTVLLTMDKGGEIVLELWPQDAPKHVENFVKLVNDKFYDGQRVHRVEPNFVVQFGDPQSKTLPVDDPRMGSGGPGYTIKAEFNKRPFERGVLGMARTDDPNSAGSQVYLMLGAAPFLNGKYTAFGRVVTGMGVVDQIRVGDRIKSIKVVTK